MPDQYSKPIVGATQGEEYDLPTLERQVTKREREIIHLMAEGLSTKEVARELHISFHTVESHRKNLLLKLKARNMVHLVAKAIRFFNIN
ncbi:MAG TPA: helix-turn-helix transcriptional regulator [Sphingobacteriaceae bacterium]|jgi:DNA-binding NarL/FixJ family response regulator